MHTQIRAEMEQQQAGFLDVLCWGTAVIAPCLSFPGMVSRWRHLTLGEGDRRPEPTVAALACGLAWCYFGHVNHHVEPFRLNALGALLQAVYLGTYLWLCTSEERERALVPIGAVLCYLHVTYIISYAGADEFKFMCTVGGSVSAAAPLLTFALLVNEWSVTMLPPWGMSCFSMLHSLAWCVRGSNKEDGHPTYAMVVQNGVGSVCSLVLLYLAWHWPPAPTTQGRDARGNPVNPPDLVEVVTEAGSPPPPPPPPPSPAPTQTHGGVRHPRSAATDDEARAVLINPDLVHVAMAAGTASVPPAPTQAQIQQLVRAAAEARVHRGLLNQDLVAVAAGRQHEE